MNILITGSAGFIGSHLYKHLTLKGNKVIGIDNFSHASGNDVKSEYADVRYYEDIDKYVKGMDIVYHLAAQINVDKSIAHPQETMDINLGGTTNILNACRRHNVVMVFASTSEVYGGHDGMINENSATYAQSPYAVSKLAADKLCGNYHEIYGTAVYRVRNFNTYGPYQGSDQYGAVIPIFIHRVLEGKHPVIFGDGTQSRDFMHVADSVRAYEMIPMHTEFLGEPVNVGTGVDVTINDLATMVCKKLGREDLIPVNIASRPGEVHKLQADVSFIKKYGFETQIPFEQGLDTYIKWYKQKVWRK